MRVSPDKLLPAPIMTSPKSNHRTNRSCHRRRQMTSAGRDEGASNINLTSYQTRNVSQICLVAADVASKRTAETFPNSNALNRYRDRLTTDAHRDNCTSSGKTRIYVKARDLPHSTVKNFRKVTIP